MTSGRRIGNVYTRKKWGGRIYSATDEVGKLYPACRIRGKVLMPHLVNCPECGCPLRVGEASLDRRVRCPRCATSFVAGAERMAARARDTEATAGRENSPLCPGCHRSVDWEVEQCPDCGHLFEKYVGAVPYRRDATPHRADVIDTLGNLSLAFGALSLCLSVLGVVVAVGTGLTALWMSGEDLNQMARGLVDPHGEARTRFGRNKAITGMLLGVAAGVFWTLIALEWLGW